MKDSLLDFLERVRVEEPTYFGAMGIAPVFAPTTSPIEFLTLDEATTQNFIKVTEVNGGGSVPNLRVINRSRRKVFLLDGEELVGAKQNRILNADILLAEKSKTVIPVSCVERGRWHYRSRALGSGEFLSPQQLRRDKAQQVHASLARCRGFRSDQSAVWGSVARMCSVFHVASDTEALHDIYTGRRETIEGYLKAFPPVPGANGLLFLINGIPFSSDLFESAATMEKYWSKIIKSCAVDAIPCEDGEKREPSLSDLKHLFERARTARIDIFDSPGLGKDLRTRGKGVAGAALAYGSTTVHVELFNTDRNESLGSEMRSPIERLRRWRLPWCLEGGRPPTSWR